MESLTDETEAAAQQEVDRIEEMGGAVAAIENGHMPKAVAKSAYERQKRLESQEEYMVGVNCFNGDNELEVSLQQSVKELYDPEHMASAEERQRAKLARLRRERDGRAVASALGSLEVSAKDEAANLMPDLIECVKSEATVQEVCDVLRGVFGEAEPVKL
jgi:methylmalonyl-CoA mutase N-terminal domain/subunit